MTTFDDRERGFEAGFVHEEEMLFRITVRRNKLVGEWAAAKMKMSGEETDAYAQAVIQADFEEAGDEDVIRKLLADLVAAGVEVDDSDIRSELADKSIEARRQLLEGE